MGGYLHELREAVGGLGAEHDALATHDALRVALVLEGGRVQPRAAHVHEVVVQVARAVGDDLEGFVGARRRDDGVGRGDGGDDVLDDALPQTQSRAKRRGYNTSHEARGPHTTRHTRRDGRWRAAKCCCCCGAVRDAAEPACERHGLPRRRAAGRASDLRVHERDARNRELRGALGRAGEDPILVGGVVLIGRVVGELLRVLDQVRVQDAVRGGARRLGDGAQRHRPAHAPSAHGRGDPDAKEARNRGGGGGCERARGGA
jgi:hypothetical protein